MIRDNTVRREAGVGRDRISRIGKRAQKQDEKERCCLIEASTSLREMDGSCGRRSLYTLYRGTLVFDSACIGESFSFAGSTSVYF